MSESRVDVLSALLVARLPGPRVAPVIKHFQTMSEELTLSNWSGATTTAGKFVEAVLKLLWDHLGKTVASGKAFKAGTIMTGLENLPVGDADDTVRTTIPRACRFVYEIASNRGARHDSGDIDPNHMDSAAVSSVCSWMLAELVRYSQKGVMDLRVATELVSSLTEKQSPLMEVVDGRVYFHLKEISAPEAALLVLWHAHPGRISKKSLQADVVRHGSSDASARMCILRLKRLVDDDGSDNLRLLAPGIKKAEQIIRAGRVAATD